MFPSGLLIVSIVQMMTRAVRERPTRSKVVFEMKITSFTAQSYYCARRTKVNDYVFHKGSIIFTTIHDCFKFLFDRYLCNRGTVICL